MNNFLYILFILLLSTVGSLIALPFIILASPYVNEFLSGYLAWFGIVVI